MCQSNITADVVMNDIVHTVDSKVEEKKEEELLDYPTTCKRKGETNSKQVSFNTVHVNEFHRCLGLDGVPSDGGWPLGLAFNRHHVIGNNTFDDDDNGGSNATDHDDKEAFVCSYSIDIDTFEKDRQEELKLRWENCILK